MAKWFKTGNILPVEEEKEENSIRKFEVIQGGLKTGGKEPPVNDWLTQLPAGTVFLTTPKIGYDPICAKITVKGHAEGEEGDSAVELHQDGHDFWVMAVRFCHKMKLVAVLERNYK